jgi:hypothetical protein
MRYDQDRQRDQAGADRNSPSVPNPIEPQSSKPPVSDPNPPIIKDERENPRVHQDPSNDQIAHPQSSHTERISIIDRYIIILTTILALTGIAGAIIIYYQLAVMRDQLEEMRGGSADTRILAQSAKAQAENTERLANAAAEQVRHLETTVTLSHESIALTKQTVRAWLVISKIERTSDFIPNTPTTFNMMLKNVGPSTALNRVFEMADWVCDGPPSLSCASRCPPPLGHEGREDDTIVGPQGEPIFEIYLSPQPQEVLNAIQSGTKTAYFCGTIGYKDVFNAPHSLNVCRFYGPKFDKFGACPIGNSDQ